jgi:hypothetical protein
MADEKKIIVDEDWKAQVQAEKEAAKKEAGGVVGDGASVGASGSGAAASGASTAGEQATPDAASAGGEPQLPPASFEMLVTTLATEALVALGQIPHPLTNKAEVQPKHAQYLIDTVEMLREKSKGNLNPREQQLIEEVLHQLRMVFIAVANQPAGEP